MIDFSGKVVLVTGGGAGIGRATVAAFADLGASVAALEIDEGRADALRAAGGDVLVVHGDATDASDVSSLVSTLGQRFGRLDVLVNNVGHFMTRPAPFEKMTDAQIDDIYRVNLKHIFSVTRAMLPLLRAVDAGASIINISSIEGFRGIPQFAVYGAFKAAVTGFTMSLALELGPEGIRVNAVAPETTDSAQVPLDRMIHESQRHHIHDGFRWAASALRRTSRDAYCFWPARWPRGCPAPWCTPTAARSPRRGGIATTGGRGRTCRSSRATACVQRSSAKRRLQNSITHILCL